MKSWEVWKGGDKGVRDVIQIFLFQTMKDQHCIRISKRKKQKGDEEMSKSKKQNKTKLNKETGPILFENL